MSHYAIHDGIGEGAAPAGGISITQAEHSQAIDWMLEGGGVTVINGALTLYRAPVYLLDDDDYLAGTADLLPEGEPLITEAPDPSLVRPRWDGSAWVEGEDPAVLEQQRTQRLLAYVNAVRDRCEQGGFLYNGWRFDSDAVSVARITGAAIAAQAALAAGEPFSLGWTDADNMARTLDAAMMLALQQALVAHADACHQLARVLKAQVEAGTLTTEAEIEAAAWPTAPGA